MIRTRIAILGTWLFAGCTAFPFFQEPERTPRPEAVAPIAAQPSPMSEWRTTLETATAAADTGSYELADQIVSNYITRYAGSFEAREMQFWRAAFKLDPSNKSGSPREGLAALDAYLADTTVIFYRPMATILHRLVNSVVALQTELATREAAIVPPPPPDTMAKVRDEEIARLKEELLKATAELDRIKKRLKKGGGGAGRRG
jgi:hypothetical protein